MSVQKYPWRVNIYKGEGRLLIVPVVRHIGGYSVDSECFINMKDIENVVEIGNGILKAVDMVRNSPISTSTDEERKKSAAWKKIPDIRAG